MTSWDGDASSLGSQPGYRWGVDLYNYGFYWEAHESWEALWRRAPRGTLAHAFLQGLIQCAAAALKARVNQPAACRSLGERGLAKLYGVLACAPGARFADLDVQAFALRFREFVELTPATTEPPKLLLLLAEFQ